MNSGVSKVVPLQEDIRIQYMACGKHHMLALEASATNTSDSPRVFSWGCGDYGVLGHGVQADEFFPRYVGTLQNLPAGEGKMSLGAGAHNQHVVSHCAAGGQTVICSTANAVTVAWGQGPHGELGLDAAKSSAKPTFVATLDGCRVADLACGYGHTLFVVRKEDAEDIAAVDKIPEVDMDSVEGLITAVEIKGTKKAAEQTEEKGSKKKKKR
jgi:alpha-tubulin suppressor-like RCC1 family protein